MMIAIPKPVRRLRSSTKAWRERTGLRKIPSESASSEEVRQNARVEDGDRSKPGSRRCRRGARIDRFTGRHALDGNPALRRQGRRPHNIRYGLRFTPRCRYRRRPGPGVARDVRRSGAHAEKGVTTKGTKGEQKAQTVCAFCVLFCAFCGSFLFYFIGA